MRAKFIGNPEDEGTQKIGIKEHGVHTINLQRTNWFSTYILRIPLVAYITVLGRKHIVPYGSMRAFEENWEIK